MKYTLAEAQKALALQECGRHGHDWEIIVKFGGDPTHILCPRCGKGWTVCGTTSGTTARESDITERA